MQGWESAFVLVKIYSCVILSVELRVSDMAKEFLHSRDGWCAKIYCVLVGQIHLFFVFVVLVNTNQAVCDQRLHIVNLVSSLSSSGL